MLLSATLERNIHGFCVDYRPLAYRDIESVEEELLAICNEFGGLDGIAHIVIGVGIVDCATRPLSKHLARSRHWFARILRLLSRQSRAFWIKHIHKTEFVPLDRFRECLTRIVNKIEAISTTTIHLLTIAPTDDRLESISPGTMRNIDAYNEVLRSFGRARVRIVDMHEAIKARGSSLCLLSDGHHINKLGNEMCAELIFESILEAEQTCSV
jgi:hypothetical protein